jgi:hypothetical protein
MAKTPTGKQLAGVAGPRKIGRGTRAQALDLIFQTAEEDHEGFRHGVLGTPRYGKTYHLKEVVAASQSRGISELALIHDCKRLDVQYEGVVRADVEDLAARPMKEDDEATIVFHGDPANGKRCSVEAVAALGLRQGRQGTATVVLIDELFHGMKARQTWEGQSFAEILREGSSQRVSSAWTTQIGQALPTEALDCTETMALFRLKGRSLRYAIDKLDVPPDAQEIVRTLERGEFILLTSVDDWDGIVYGPT